MPGDSQELYRLEGAALVRKRKAFNLFRPPVNERNNNLDYTKRAIESLITSKCEDGGMDFKVSRKNTQERDYKSNGSSTRHNLIISEKELDPFEPPRHRHRKHLETDVVDEGNRAPILRPAPRKLTKEEKERWRVPQSVSNWKNSRGLMIDRAKDNSSRASNSLTAVEKRLDLSSALQNASEEFSQDTLSTDESNNRSSELKRRLLEQKSKNSSADENNNVFDSRLFHHSKRHAEDYDSELFTSKKTKMTSKLKNNEVEFEPAK